MIFGNRLYFQKKKGGFTMVELIVVLTIVAILAAISFVSYTSMMSDARNSVRKTDMSEMKVRLRGIAQKVGAYPLPSAPFAMTNSGYLAVNQGNTDTVETEEGGSPRKDPKSKTSYVYSTVTNRHGYQIGMILEGENDTYNSLVDGDYIPLVPSVFPSLILAITSTSTIEVHDGIGAGSANRTKFVVQNGTLNLPYNITGWTFATATSFSGVITETGVNLTKSSNYSSCQAIYEGGKNMGPGDYLIIDSTGALTMTGCIMNPPTY